MKKSNAKITKMRIDKQSGIIFVISGWLTQDLLLPKLREGDTLSLELIDINCQVFLGGSLELNKKRRTILTKRLYFKQTFHFSIYNINIFIQTGGRIVLRLSNHETRQGVFIPLTIKPFLPENERSEVAEEHKRVGGLITYHEKCMKSYMQEFEKIWSRKEKKLQPNQLEGIQYQHVQMGLALDLFSLLEANREGIVSPFETEDEELRQLNEKYKETLRILGPFFGETILVNNGFYAVIYTNDHGKHVHVIHKGQEIDARFSFPKIEFINYKKGNLRSKQIKKIVNWLKEPENFKKLEEQFQRVGRA